MQNILFRADSSSVIGTGHIMRDLVLAHKYVKKGYNVKFATQNLDGNINNYIINNNFEIVPLLSNKESELLEIIKKLNIDMIIFDSYEVDYNYEKYIKKQANIKIFSFDDTYEKHYCDILLNHNICGEEKKYKKLVPKKCKLKCGSKYTLLRDEFIENKKKNKKNKKKNKNIFLAMGGADTASLNISILEILKNFENIKVNIITTNANKNLQELKKYCKNKSWMKLHINSTKIAKIMAKSDLAIITPSVILNEIYYMKVPFVAIKTAKNQIYMYRFLKKMNYTVLNKFNRKNLFNSITKNIDIL